LALTSAERAQVRTVLGYADTPAYPNTWLEGTLSALSSDAEAQVRALLGELAAIDAQLTDCRANRLKVSTVDGINLSGPGEMRALLREASRRAHTISLIVGIEKAGDPYKSGSGGALRMG
jgi:hypothetical protein